MRLDVQSVRGHQAGSCGGRVDRLDGGNFHKPPIRTSLLYQKANVEDANKLWMLVSQPDRSESLLPSALFSWFKVP